MKVRPTCFFDSAGTVEQDFGTQDYIGGIHVTTNREYSGFEVHIKGKRHLTYSPLVSGIDVGLFPYSSSRTAGTMNDWTIKLAPQTTAELLGAEGSSYVSNIYHFKLEIIH